MAAPTPNTGYRSQELLSFLKLSLLDDDYNNLIGQIEQALLEEKKKRHIETYLKEEYQSSELIRKK